MQNTPPLQSQTLALSQETLTTLSRQAGHGALLGGLAHELNNPLGYVCGNFNLLKTYLAQHQSLLADVPDLGDILGDITQGLDSLTQLVSSMRKLAGADTSGFSDYDLNEGLRTTLAASYNLVKYVATVDISLESLPLIPAVAGELNQVLLTLVRLCVDAVKASSEKKPAHLTLRSFSTEASVVCQLQAPGILPAAHPSLDFTLAVDIAAGKHRGALRAEQSPENSILLTLEVPKSTPLLPSL